MRAGRVVLGVGERRGPPPPRDSHPFFPGGATALLKAQSTKTFEFCAREAAQIFGGASYVRGGQGEKVERLYREVRAYAIPGGSEEIMLDLAVRQVRCVVVGGGGGGWSGDGDEPGA